MMRQSSPHSVPHNLRHFVMGALYIHIPKVGGIRNCVSIRVACAHRNFMQIPTTTITTLGIIHNIAIVIIIIELGALCTLRLFGCRLGGAHNSNLVSFCKTARRRNHQSYRHIENRCAFLFYLHNTPSSPSARSFGAMVETHTSLV